MCVGSFKTSSLISYEQWFDAYRELSNTQGAHRTLHPERSPGQELNQRPTHYAVTALTTGPLWHPNGCVIDHVYRCQLHLFLWSRLFVKPWDWKGMWACTLALLCRLVCLCPNASAHTLMPATKAALREKNKTILSSGLICDCSTLAVVQCNGPTRIQQFFLSRTESERRKKHRWKLTWGRPTVLTCLWSANGNMFTADVSSWQKEINQEFHDYLNVFFNACIKGFKYIRVFTLNIFCS